jgi:hypothetical protein
MLFSVRTSKIVADGGFNEKSLLFVVLSNPPGAPIKGRAITLIQLELERSMIFLITGE